MSLNFCTAQNPCPEVSRSGVRMSLVSRATQWLAIVLLALPAALVSLPSQAGDHGGGGGPEPLVFLVNLGPTTFLNFGLILETATPEAAHELAS